LITGKQNVWYRGSKLSHDHAYYPARLEASTRTSRISSYQATYPSMTITLHDERRSIGSSSATRRNIASDETNWRSQAKSLLSSLSWASAPWTISRFTIQWAAGVGKENLIQLPEYVRLLQGSPAPLTITWVVSPVRGLDPILPCSRRQGPEPG
jgi:hypothetical protein